MILTGLKVKETISHGDYRNVRVVELPDTSHATVLEMLRDAPYMVSRPENVALRLRMALESGGSYSYGWTEWEVVR